MSREIILGSGRSAFPARYPSGELGGFRITHPRGGVDGAEPCHENGSWITIDQEFPVHWTMVSEEPLTLTPSLLCRLCGDHGWIRNGAWVPTRKVTP